MLRSMAKPASIMPKTVTTPDAKATVSQLPLAPPKPKRAPGALKGKIALDPSFFEPLLEDELRRWE
jgi:hypothetical protein